MVDKNGHVCIMNICYLLTKKLKKIRNSRILFYFHVYVEMYAPSSLSPE